MADPHAPRAGESAPEFRIPTPDERYSGFVGPTWVDPAPDSTPSIVTAAKIGTAQVGPRGSAPAPSVAAAPLDAMAERLSRRLGWVNATSYRARDAIVYALTGLPPGPERDAALAAILARIAPAPSGPAEKATAGLREADNALVGAAMEAVYRWGLPHAQADDALLEKAAWMACHALLCRLSGAREAALAGETAGDGLLPIGTAPYGEEVEVQVGAMRFLARLVPDGSLDSDGDPCDQWQATREGEHPPCWTDGACWESNADLSPSLQPSGWRPAPSAVRPVQGGDDHG